MKLKEIKLTTLISFLIPLLLFWVVLILRIPHPVTIYFNTYSFGLFIITFLLYYLSFRLQDNRGVLVGFGLSMLLFALALSHKWASGFSDNFIIGGLLPYKDAKNYYLGAHLILDGLPMVNAGQATERPLFPGFLSSLLLLTGQNLKIALAILVQLAGIGLYLSARQVRHSIGAVSAALYASLMYFYILPLIGYTLSELLGFMLGCFAFLLIVNASLNSRWIDLTLGLIALLLAVSARPGAFFVFPMLILWAGWIFRGATGFSIRKALLAFVVIFVGYFLINRIYAQLLGIPAGSAFGNFSYALYGQVKGGTGWHSAIEELGTREPAVVFRAAWEFFLDHPLSFFIGAAKSYRDFFLPGDLSIFPVIVRGWQDLPNLMIGLVILALVLWGFIKVLKDIRLNLPSLLSAAFIGIILSIPFLPPVDGGSRFHASTTPFFFILPAFGVKSFFREQMPGTVSADQSFDRFLIPRFVSVILIFLIFVMPIGLRALRQKPFHTVPACPPQQRPFVIEAYRGSYIELIKEGTTPCGFVPEVCSRDFEEHNTEKSSDDFYQHLLLLTAGSEGNVRIIPSMDLVQEKFHYFYVSRDILAAGSSFDLIAGCATPLETKSQSVYLVESVLPNLK